eukprot:1179389-Prorocentrum_minimum.AAC.4
MNSTAMLTRVPKTRAEKPGPRKRQPVAQPKRRRLRPTVRRRRLARSASEASSDSRFVAAWKKRSLPALGGWAAAYAPPRRASKGAWGGLTRHVRFRPVCICGAFGRAGRGFWGGQWGHLDSGLAGDGAGERAKALNPDPHPPGELAAACCSGLSGHRGPPKSSRAEPPGPGLSPRGALGGVPANIWELLPSGVSGGSRERIPGRPSGGNFPEGG